MIKESCPCGYEPHDIAELLEPIQNFIDQNELEE